MSGAAFAQLVMTLKRHRYATDNPFATTQEALLDKLITRLAGSLNKSFVLEKFCEQEQCSERALRQQFRTRRDDGQPLSAPAAHLPRPVPVTAYGADGE